MVTFKGRKKAIESLYEDLCTVYEYAEVKDPITKITTKSESEVITAQPCRVSYKTIAISEQSDVPAYQKQEVKLFIDPSLDIKAGSKISITRHGVTRDYNHSGVSAIYSDHQEIILTIFTGYRSYS